MLTIENTDSDLKVHELHYANELLVRVSFPVKNFCKLAQHAEALGSFSLDYEYEIEYEYDFSVLVFRLHIITTLTHFIP